MKAPSRHPAGGVARQASFANIWPQAVDRARRRDADLPDKRGAAIAAASHAAAFVINIRAGDLSELGVRFQ